MGKITFILGGTRSGKSSYAVELAKKLNKKTAYIATSMPKDEEMKKRVKLHKKSRPSHWKTIEEEKDLDRILKQIHYSYKVVIIDCITLFISNLLLDNLSHKAIQEKINKLIKLILKSEYIAIVVSNEVGSGIVPDNKLARDFRDIVGNANQIFSKYADEVIFMKAGIPLKIKGNPILPYGE